VFDDVHVRRLPKATSEVEWITGACFLIRRDVFETVQGFDEAYFMYVEDMDLCYRLRQAGYTNLYVPEAVAYHERGRSPRSDRRVVIEGGQAPEYFVKKTGMRYPLGLQRTLRWWLLTTYMGTLSVRLAAQRLRGQDSSPTRQLIEECRRSLRAIGERSSDAEPKGSVRLGS
jgi:GT2 family glycosyltransferase